MSSPLIQQLARNNAGWCAAVCRARGVGGRSTEHLWVCEGTPPPYYPNIITLAPLSPSLLDELATAVEGTSRNSTSLSTKDSFGDVDLRHRGFRLLFEAQWLTRSPSAAPGAQPDNFVWSAIDTVRDLDAWKQAWDAQIIERDPVFAPALLADPAIAIMAARSGDEIVAGAIASSHAGVVGLSNFFCGTVDPAPMLSGFCSMATARYPGLHIAAYERTDDAAPYLNSGFVAIGPLRVWVSNA